MLKRTKAGQFQHDQKVLQRYEFFRKIGAWVRADLPDHAKPPKIKGRIPDIYAKIGKQLFVEEVETRDTIDKDYLQHKLLEKGTEEKGGTFRIIQA